MHAHACVAQARPLPSSERRLLLLGALLYMGMYMCMCMCMVSVGSYYLVRCSQAAHALGRWAVRVEHMCTSMRTAVAYVHARTCACIRMHMYTYVLHVVAWGCA